MKFRIPKQRDQVLIAALNRVRLAMKDRISIRIGINRQLIGEITLPEEKPEEGAEVKELLALDGENIEKFWMHTDSHPNQQARRIVNVERKYDQIYDEVDLNINGSSIQSNDTRKWADIYAVFQFYLQRELGGFDFVKARATSDDTTWDRYRDSQISILNRLENASTSLIEETSKRAAENEAAERSRYNSLREQLEAQTAALRKQLEDNHQMALADLKRREDELQKVVKDFETREASFVARQKTQEQINQIKDWLKEPDYTENTRKKRRPVFWTSLIGMSVGLGLTIWLSWGNADILKAAGTNLPQVPWWQWLLLTLKTLGPFAVFISFATYFVRWSSAWAKEHSDAEARNRLLLIDIGRSAWLLEAVRDARGQKREGELPKELISELSRNLFSSSLSVGKEVNLETPASILGKNLSSLKIKTPGLEVGIDGNDKK